MKKFMEKHWEKALLMFLVVLLVILSYGIIDLITYKYKQGQTTNSNIQDTEEHLMAEQQTNVEEEPIKDDVGIGEEEKTEQKTEKVEVTF